MNGDKRFRVWNRCKHDIGVYVSNGQQSLNIKTGSFAVLPVDDIMYIESICNQRKLFSAKMLVPVDENGKDLTLEDLGGYSSEDVEVHLNEAEIKSNLEKSFKNFKSWIETIEDPVELHAIWEVGKTLDLPQSKLKVIQSKIPYEDLLADEAE